MPYSPYKFFETHDGTTKPFNQRDIRNNNLITRPSCNGFLLKWIKMNLNGEKSYFDSSFLNNSNLIFSQQHIDFKKQIGDAEQFQKLAPTDIELRKCLQAMAFQPQLFKNKLDGNNLIKFVVEWIESIEKVTQQKASSQLMYIVGECRTTTKDRDEHPGVHAFGIYFDVDVNEIKWFEANRGEVAFKHPKNFIAWLQHEFDQGELKVLNKRHKIQEDEYRQYISFEAYTFIGIPHCQPERQLEHLPQARL